jgi:hypothetical protein
LAAAGLAAPPAAGAAAGFAPPRAAASFSAIVNGRPIGGAGGGTAFTGSPPAAPAGASAGAAAGGGAAAAGAAFAPARAAASFSCRVNGRPSFCGVGTSAGGAAGAGAGAGGSAGAAAASRGSAASSGAAAGSPPPGDAGPPRRAAARISLTLGRLAIGQSQTLKDHDPPTTHPATVRGPIQDRPGKASARPVAASPTDLTAEAVGPSRPHTARATAARFPRLGNPRRPVLTPGNAAPVHGTDPAIDRPPSRPGRTVLFVEPLP